MAVLLGRWWDAPPFRRLEGRWGGQGAGIAAPAPLFVALWWGLTPRWGPAVRFGRMVQERIGPLFAGAGPGSLLLVALAAGVGEEALFRGVIQDALGARMPPAAAITLAAVLFGALHWVSGAYAVLACLVGAYLGVLYETTGTLLAPIVTHALYDLVALLVLTRVKPGPVRAVWGTGPQ